MSRLTASRSPGILAGCQHNHAYHRFDIKPEDAFKLMAIERENTVREGLQNKRNPQIYKGHRTTQQRARSNLSSSPPDQPWSLPVWRRTLTPTICYSTRHEVPSMHCKEQQTRATSTSSMLGRAWPRRAPDWLTRSSFRRACVAKVSTSGRMLPWQWRLMYPATR